MYDKEERTVSSHNTNHFSEASALSLRHRTICGLTGRLGNRMLQHIDAIRTAQLREIIVSSVDKECGKYLKLPDARGILILRAKWLLSEVLFAPDPIQIPRYFRTIDELYSDKSNYLALHVRGTDFHLWKKHAVTEPEFFIRAASNSIYPYVYLVTDDPNSQRVQIIVDGVRSAGRNILIRSGNSSSDFMALMRAREIFASPSTFALAASILGARQVTFPIQYAQVEARAGAKFWRQLLDGERPNYCQVHLQ
jgi:hypothetical protein